jgi:hypothetical protein
VTSGERQPVRVFGLLRSSWAPVYRVRLIRLNCFMPPPCCTAAQRSEPVLGDNVDLSDLRLLHQKVESPGDLRCLVSPATLKFKIRSVELLSRLWGKVPKAG